MIRKTSVGRPGVAKLIAGLAASSLLLAACGGTNSGTTSNASGATDGGAGSSAQDLALFKDMTPGQKAQAVDTSKFKTDKKQLKIGYVDFGAVNSWRVQALGETKLVAAKLGVDLIVTDAGGDATKQISDAEDTLARGVDALLVSPVAPDALAPIVERATASGIPVIIWGSDINTKKYTAKVVADDFFFGQDGAKKLVADLNGKGKVIMLRGIAGNSVEKARYDGAVSAFKGTDIKIVAEEYGNWAFDKGKSITETLLTAQPQIDGVWSSGAAMTRGAVQAFQEAKRPLVPMSGENLNGFLKLAAQLNLKTSGPQFPTWQGPEALKLAVRALRGMEIKSEYLLRAPSITDASKAAVPDVSDDYWVEDYLTKDQIKQIFPK